MSMIAGAAGLPEIKFPAEEVASQIKELLGGLPAELESTETTIKNEWEAAKAKKEDYKLLGVDGKSVLVVLKPDSDDKAVRSAAYKQVGKGKFAETAADQVWSAVEPKVDEQKPASIPDTPVMTGDQLWGKAKDKVGDKVKDQVKKKIEEAIDELLKKKNA
jgi:hypothetical protein